MNRSRALSLLAAATASAALAVGAGSGPAQAKSISSLPAACTQGTAVNMVYMSQGSKVTLGASSTDPASLGTWHILITDNGAPVINRDFTPGVSSWSISTTRTLAKGTHVLALEAVKAGSGEVCTLSVTNKV